MRSRSFLATMVLGIVVMTSLLLISLAGGGEKTTTAPGSKRLEGWQEAKFGMNLEEVKARIPNATEEFEIVEECESSWDKEAKQTAEIFRQDGPIDVSTPHDCRYLAISKFDGGRDKFFAKIYFSKLNKQLQEIELSSALNEGAYLHYKGLLEGKYGKGAESTNQQDLEKECDSYKRQLRYAKTRVGAEHIAHRIVTTIPFVNAALQIESRVIFECPFYQENEAQWKYYNLVKKSLDQLWIRYTSQPKTPPQDAQRF